MAEFQPIIVFHGRHFVRHIGICNPICVKFLQYGVTLRNLKKNDVSISNRFLVSTNAEYTQTDTQDDSNTRNAMHCISPKNALIFLLYI